MNNATDSRLSACGKALPKYVVQSPDNRGKLRVRYVRRGHKSSYLTAEIGTPEFEQEYALAVLKGHGVFVPMEPHTRETSLAASIFDRMLAISPADVPTESKRVPECLYIMGDGKRFKVGKSVNPYKRAINVRSDVPDAQLLEVYTIRSRDAYIVETSAHHMLHGYRDRGEWFTAPINVVRNAVRLAIATNGTAIDTERRGVFDILGFLDGPKDTKV